MKRLRSMSPDFDTPLFYFKPYPGSPITAEVVRAGYSLPRTLEEWAEFDFIGVSSDHCTQCGYLLQGLTGGQCPECGARIEAAPEPFARA